MEHSYNKKLIINDALGEEEFKNIRNHFLSDYIPWMYNDGVVTEDPKDFQMVHMVYDLDFLPPQYEWEIFQPLLYLLKPHCLIKVKANLRTKTSEKEVSDWHTDNHAVGGYTAIFYLNTNDGTTVFHDGDQIESKENRLVVFPSHLLHSGTTPTNTNRRVLLNINYIPNLEDKFYEPILRSEDKKYIKFWTDIQNGDPG